MSQGSPSISRFGGSVQRWEVLAVAAALVALTAIAITAILLDPPLGHDEAVYALRARMFATDDAWVNGYFFSYRAVGLPALPTPAWLLGGADQVVRLAMVEFAVAATTLTWLLARTLLDARAGVVAAWLVALSPLYAQFSWQVPVDLPASVFVLAAAAVFVAAIRTDPVPRWIWFVAPLGIAATVVRYGAPVQLAAVLGVFGLAHSRAVRRSLAVVVGVAVTMAAGAAVLLFVPAVTGVELARAQAIRSLATKKGVGHLESFAYLPSQTAENFGWQVGGAIVVGLVLAVPAIRRGRYSARSVVGLAAAGLVFYVALHTTLILVDPLYLTPGVPYLAAGASAGLVYAAERLRSSLPWGVAVGS